MAKSTKRKNPWIAVALNILAPGMAYLYLGRRQTFGLLLIVSELAFLVWSFNDPFQRANFTPSSLEVIGIICFTSAFAIDAYNQSQEA